MRKSWTGEARLAAVQGLPLGIPEEATDLKGKKGAAWLRDRWATYSPPGFFISFLSRRFLDFLCHLQVELLCNDSVLDPNSDLRTVLLNRNIWWVWLLNVSFVQVKHFIWKSGSDLVLHYRPLQWKCWLLFLNILCDHNKPKYFVLRLSNCIFMRHQHSCCPNPQNCYQGLSQILGPFSPT